MIIGKGGSVSSDDRLRMMKNLMKSMRRWLFASRRSALLHGEHVKRVRMWLTKLRSVDRGGSGSVVMGWLQQTLMLEG